MGLPSRDGAERGNRHPVDVLFLVSSLFLYSVRLHVWFSREGGMLCLLLARGLVQLLLSGSHVVDGWFSAPTLLSAPLVSVVLPPPPTPRVCKFPMVKKIRGWRDGSGVESTAPAEDWCSASSSHTGWPTTAHNANSRGPYTSVLHRHPKAHAHTHAETNIRMQPKLKIKYLFKKNPLKAILLVFAKHRQYCVLYRVQLAASLVCFSDTNCDY